ncbi:hypothetical protein [Enterobacter ludwigii]
MAIRQIAGSVPAGEEDPASSGRKGPPVTTTPLPTSHRQAVEMAGAAVPGKLRAG